MFYFIVVHIAESITCFAAAFALVTNLFTRKLLKRNKATLKKIREMQQMQSINSITDFAVYLVNNRSNQN